MPWGTVLINVVGCFIIGFFGTYTLASGRHATAENMRLFVMVGICGGFTTFSSFSLQTFDLVREGAWAKALAHCHRSNRDGRGNGSLVAGASLLH